MSPHSCTESSNAHADDARGVPTPQRCFISAALAPSSRLAEASIPGLEPTAPRISRALNAPAITSRLICADTRYIRRSSRPLAPHDGSRDFKNEAQHARAELSGRCWAYRLQRVPLSRQPLILCLCYACRISPMRVVITGMRHDFAPPPVTRRVIYRD